MARQKGVSTFVKIPLARLNEVLREFPNVKIAVGKGNLAELESALSVDFGVSEDEATVASEATGKAADADSDAPLAGMNVD